MDTLLSREIRVFLSSTFQDMNAERNYLMQYIFPEIRRRCAERGAGFTEIDLRWGITESDAKNGRTVEICLAEIDRCRDYPPFFFGFLGERYGWIPKAEDLEGYWLKDTDSPYRSAIEDALQKGISVTELEIRFGVLNRLDMHQHAYFFLRSPNLTKELQLTADDASNGVFYDDGKGKLAILKQALIESGRVKTQKYESLQSFGEQIKQILLEQIDQRFPADEAKDVFAIQLRSHTLFAQSRRQTYVPLPSMREKILTQIQSNINGQYHKPILITGDSGLGKSAFIADLAVWLPESLGALVIDHYIGADGHLSLEAWRDRILNKLRSFSPIDSPLPEDDLGKWDALPLWLSQAKENINMPIILLLDALDQLHDNGTALTRLGEAYWPKGVIVIASTIHNKNTSPLLWNIQTLSSPSREERREMINVFTRAYRKSLESNLGDKLLDSIPATTPLFLRIVLEDLRTHGKYETLEQRLNTLLQKSDTAELFTFLLREWDRDYGDRTHPKMASRLTAMLAASRQGLSEHELTELLAVQSDPISLESQRPRVPIARISLLLAVLKSYLLRNAGQDTLMHSALARGSLATTTAYEIREFIISYFQGNSPRALAERLYQKLQLLEVCSIEDIHLIKKSITTELLQPQYASLLYVEDDKLLRDTLAILGASDHTITEEVRMLINSWESPDANWDRVNSDISKWMLDMSFLTLNETWCKGLLVHHKKSNSDVHTIAVCLKNLGRVFYSTLREDEAAHLFEEALVLLKQHPKPDYQEIAKVQNNLALIYSDQGKFDEAKVLHEQNLDIKQSAANPNYPSIAHSLNNLGALYSKQGILDLAKKFYENALKTRRFSLPPHHPDIAYSLNNLSLVYLKQNQNDAAMSARLDALRILRNALPSNHKSIASSLINLASMYQDQGHLEKAMSFNLEALEIYKVSLPKEHPNVALVLNNLAILYRESKQLDKAEEFYIEVIKIRRNAQTPDTSKLANNLLSLGNIYRQQKRLNEAEQMYQESLQVYRRAVPHKPLGDADCLHNLGLIYKEQKQLNDSEKAFEEALSIYQQALPANHPKTAQCLFNLAVTYKLNKKLEQAELSFKDSLAIRRLTIPLKPLDIANCLSNLGIIYKEKKQLNDSEKTLEEALSIYQQSLPANHPDIAQCLFNLAATYKRNKKPEQAEILYKASLEIRRNSTPLKSLSIADCLNNLGIIYKEQNRLDDAEKMHEEALSIRRQSLPQNHINIAYSLSGLANTYSDQGKLNEAELLYQESLQIRRNATPLKPLDIANCLYTLAQLYQKQDKLKEAESLMIESLDIRQNTLPHDNPELVKTIKALEKIQSQIDM